MVLAVKLLMILFILGTCESQIFDDPPLCGKSAITNTRFKRVGEKMENHAPRPTSVLRTIPARKMAFLPYVASVQKFDTTDLDGEDIFDRRLSGAFVGAILGPTVVLVACRCVARHMGRVGGDEESSEYTKQFGVMAGTPFDYSPVDGIFGQIRFTSRIVVHPKCELLPSLYLWDLAVLVLDSPFHFIQNKVEAAPIPKTSVEINQFLKYATLGLKTSFTVGWGWAFNSYKPENLEVRIHPLFVRDFKLCNDSAAAEYFEAHVSPTNMHVCIETAASYLRLQRTGDVGSPLLGFVSGNKTTKTIQYIVLGIKSEEDDATPDGFALFTRLDVDLDWLWDLTRNPPNPINSAISTNFTSLQMLLFVVWTRTLHILGVS